MPARLSVRAVVACVGFAVGDAIETAGGALSVRVTVTVSVAVRPAASRAVTVMTLAPPHSSTNGTVQVVVPVATPDPPLSLDHRTSVTPNASDATPPRTTAAFAVE